MPGAIAEDARAEAVLRIFEKQMLESIGYGLVLDRDIDSGEPIHGDCAYRYEMDRGPTNLEIRDGDGVRVAGETLLSLARERLETERALDEAKQLMRVVLRRYLGDKPLATRSLFRARVHSGESRAGIVPDNPLHSRHPWRSDGRGTSPGTDGVGRSTTPEPTSPGMDEVGRSTTPEPRAKHDARADESRDGRGRAKHDCRDAGGRAMPGEIAEDATAGGTD